MAPKPKTVNPVLTKRFGDVVQIDLIDMTNMGNEEYKYILNIRDHASGFVWLTALSMLFCALSGVGRVNAHPDRRVKTRHADHSIVIDGLVDSL